MSATTCTSSPVLVKVTVPVTWLPDDGLSSQVAFVASCACPNVATEHISPSMINVFIRQRTPFSAKAKPSIEQPSVEAGVSVHAPVAQKGPVGAMLVNA